VLFSSQVPLTQCTLLGPFYASGAAVRIFIDFSRDEFLFLWWCATDGAASWHHSSVKNHAQSLFSDAFKWCTGISHEINLQRQTVQYSYTHLCKIYLLICCCFKFDLACRQYSPCFNEFTIWAWSCYLWPTYTLHKYTTHILTRLLIKSVSAALYTGFVSFTDKAIRKHPCTYLILFLLVNEKMKFLVEFYLKINFSTIPGNIVAGNQPYQGTL